MVLNQDIKQLNYSFNQEYMAVWSPQKRKIRGIIIMLLLKRETKVEEDLVVFPLLRISRICLLRKVCTIIRPSSDTYQGLHNRLSLMMFQICSLHNCFWGTTDLQVLYRHLTLWRILSLARRILENHKSRLENSRRWARIRKIHM